MLTPNESRRLAELEQAIAGLARMEFVPPLRDDHLPGVGRTISIDEALLPDTQFDAVVKIVDGELHEGTLDTYDALTQPLEDLAWTDADPIWVVDLGDSESLPADELHPALLVRDADGEPVIVPGGPFLVNLLAVNGPNYALNDATKWLPVVGSITPAAWSGVTAYVAGNLVSSGGSTYICILGHTNQVPPNSTYWKLVVLANAGGYLDDGIYEGVGVYVQEKRPLYAIRVSASSGIETINGDMTPAQEIVADRDGTALLQLLEPGQVNFWDEDLYYPPGNITKTNDGFDIFYWRSLYPGSVGEEPAEGSDFWIDITDAHKTIIRSYAPLLPTFESSDNTITISFDEVFDVYDLTARVASNLVSGIVSTDTQSFGGWKIFHSYVTVMSGVGMGSYASFNVLDNGGSTVSWLGGMIHPTASPAGIASLGLHLTTNGIKAGIVASGSVIGSLPDGGFLLFDATPDVLFADPQRQPAYAVGRARHTFSDITYEVYLGQWKIVAGLQFTGGIFTGGSFSVGGSGGGLTITTGGTEEEPELDIDGILEPANGGTGIDTSGFVEGQVPIAVGNGTFSGTVPLWTTQGGLGVDASGWSSGSVPEADGTGEFVEKKNNYAGGGQPTVNDDSGDGYRAGSIWIG